MKDTVKVCRTVFLFAEWGVFLSETRYNITGNKFRTGLGTEMGLNERKVRKQICDIGRRIFNRNMVAANDGNISVKIDDGVFLCTPTGVSKGFMTEESICKIDEKGNLIEAADGFRPSSEMKMHMRVYEKRPDIGAVVHAHPMYGTSFAALRTPLARPVMSEAVVNFGCIPVVEYGTPSTMEIPDNLEKYLNDFDAVLLANHGALTYDADLNSAYMKMESLEFYAELLYRTKLLGGAVEFDSENIKRLHDIRKTYGMKGRHPGDAVANGGRPACSNCESCMWLGIR